MGSLKLLLSFGPVKLAERAGDWFRGKGTGEREGKEEEGERRSGISNDEYRSLSLSLSLSLEGNKIKGATAS